MERRAGGGGPVGGEVASSLGLRWCEVGYQAVGDPDHGTLSVGDSITCPEG